MELATGNYVFNNSTGIEEAKAEKLKTENPKLEIYPNPFSGEAIIRFTTYDLRPTVIKIFNAAGRLVKNLSRFTNYDGRSTQVVWNGTDDSGRRVPAGIYFCQLKYGTKEEIKKLIKVQ